MSYFSRFNPMPAFPAYEGPYQVGTAEIELPVKDLADSSITPPNPDISTVHFRIFYPCESGSTNPRPVRWLPSPQRNILSAYVEFIGAGSYMANAISLFPRHLYYINIPATRDAPLLQASTSTSKWPVMIFSHGLGGSKNAYSHMCGSMASHGMVVIAPEHRDASCPISFIRSTDTSPRREIRYNRYSHAPSPEVYEGRDAQLKIRLWELNIIHTALLRLEAGNVPTNLKTDCVDLSMFQGKLDVTRPGAITFGGHSFGACTTVQTVKSTFYNDRTLFTPSPALKAQITTTTPVILLDLWTLPLGSPNTAALWEKPMPCFSSPTTPSGVPLIAVLSESFVKWPVNLSYTRKALKDPYSASVTTPRSAAHLFYPLRSAHLSQSDFAILFPTVTRYLAKADDPGRTINLNVRAILQALREGGVEVVGFSQTGGRDEDVALDARAKAAEEAELVGGSESDTADDCASDGILNSESEGESETESDSDANVDETGPVDVFQTPFEMPADASPFDFTELKSAADLLPVPDPKSSAPMATLKFQPDETAFAVSGSISKKEDNGTDWDFSILSTREGAVRGWVAIDVA